MLIVLTLELEAVKYCLIDCIFMDQAGSGGDFLELGDKWYMGTVHDVISPYDI